MKHYLITLIFITFSTKIFATESKIESEQQMRKKRRVLLINQDILNFWNNEFGTEYGIPEDDTPLLEKSDELNRVIYSYLEPKDIVQLSSTNKQYKYRYSNKPNSIGSYLRDQTKFSVMDTQSSIYYLEEYLSKTQVLPFHRVNNLGLLAKVHPNNFIKLVLKRTPENFTTENDFRYFYAKTIQINKLIDDLPRYDSAQEKLAAFMLDYFAENQVTNQFWKHTREIFEYVWDQIKTQTWMEHGNYLRNLDDVRVKNLLYHQVINHVWTDVWTQSRVHVLDLLSLHLWKNIWNQLRNQVNDQVSDQVWSEIRTHVQHHVLPQIKLETKEHVNEKIINQIRIHVAASLSSINVTSLYKNGELDQKLKLLSRYNFMACQLASIVSKHIASYKNILGNKEFGFIKFISEHITEEQAENILTNIRFPEADNYFAKIQYEILKRHLP